MASSSSTPSNPLLAQSTEKLAKTNHALWFAQVRAIIRGAKLLGYLTGESRALPATILKLGADDKEVKDAAGKVIMIKNLDFKDWDATDQQVLSYLLGSLSKDVLVQVSSCNTVAEAWAMIQGMYASQTRSRSVNTRISLATAHKGTSTVIKYFDKMKALGDEMAASGRPLDEELVEYIITDLDDEYTPLVYALCTRKEPISVSELYSQMLNFETRIDLFQEEN
jgi:hypothetical protein